MRREAFVVYLRAPLEVLAQRIRHDGPRPWLEDDPAAAIATLHEGREPLYEEVASLILDVADSSPDELAERILAAAGT